MINIEIEKPNITCVSANADGSVGEFVVEPLERGYGTTLGNSLRRILLSSLAGYAVTSVKIDGVLHEISTVSGVKEDVPEIILNVKGIVAKLHVSGPKSVTIDMTGPCEVTAGDIQGNQHVSVLNPELHIATLTEDVEFNLEFEVRMGKGYVPADMHEGLSDEIGIIKLDSSFSPVRKVAYTIEAARVGQMTNYDKLILEVWTDGSVTPEDAIAYSAKIIKDQISVFINFDEHISDESGLGACDNGEFNENLFKSIDDLELSVRATNCLRSANIALVGELVQRSENEMLKTKNFGKKSLDEIKNVLLDMGLDFGMKVDSFDKKYQEWKRKQHHEA